MSINETNVTGRKYRVWDAANNIWKRLSFWTKASDVEMNDGTTVEANITTLKGKAGFIGTTAEINEALSQGLIPDGGLVYNTDDNYELDISAGQVTYDNTDTGLLATNVQDAVDELSSDLTGVKSALSLKTRIVGVKNCHSNIATNSKFHVKEYGKIIEYSSQASDGFHIYGSLPANTKVCDIDDSNIPGYSSDYVFFTGMITSSGATVSNLHYHYGGIYTNVALSHGDARIVFSFKVLKET